MKKIYELAVRCDKPVMPHSPTAGVNSVTSFHAYATVKNTIRPHEFSTEFSGPLNEVAELFIDPILPDNGWIHLPDRPGFGLELDEKAVQRQKA